MEQNDKGEIGMTDSELRVIFTGIAEAMKSLGIYPQESPAIATAFAVFVLSIGGASNLEATIIMRENTFRSVLAFNHVSQQCRDFCNETESSVKTEEEGAVVTQEERLAAIGRNHNSKLANN